MLKILVGLCHAVLLLLKWTEVLLDVISCECIIEICNNIKRKILNKQINYLTSYTPWSSYCLKISQKVGLYKFPERDTWTLYF